MNEFRRPLHDNAPARVLTADVCGAAASRCFDDEVAIDFPSMGAVVDRMRDAMLGSDREPIPRRAHISLSPRQALVGARVSLELPVRCTCRDCGGRGESWTESCRHCAGSGERSMPHRFTVSLPAGVADGTRFRVLVVPPQELPTRVEVTVLVA